MNTPPNIDLSVVIPVYNTAQWLPECLDSVLRCPLQAMEVILVDDCSTDGSVDILKTYASRDKRIRLVLQSTPSGTPATGRNIGIEQAKGTYTAFIDSDDYISANLLETSVRQAQGADVCYCDIMFVTGKHHSIWSFRKHVPKSTTNEFCANSATKHFWTNFHWQACFKMYRTAFLREERLRFNLDSTAEDIMFGMYTLLLAKRIKYLPGEHYCYRIGRCATASQTGSRSEQHRWAIRLLGVQALLKIKQFINSRPTFSTGAKTGIQLLMLTYASRTIHSWNQHKCKTDIAITLHDNLLTLLREWLPGKNPAEQLPGIRYWENDKLILVLYSRAFLGGNHHCLTICKSLDSPLPLFQQFANSSAVYGLYIYLVASLRLPSTPKVQVLSLLGRTIIFACLQKAKRVTVYTLRSVMALLAYVPKNYPPPH